MKRLAAAVFFAVIFLAFIAQAADELVLSGTWILDQGKSDAFPRNLRAGNDSGVGDVGRGGGRGGGGGMGGMGGGGAMGGMGAGMGRGMGGPGAFTPPPLIIEQNGNEVKLITKMQMQGKEMPPIIETFVCDGKQHEEMAPAFPGSAEKTKQTTKATLKKDNKLVVERINFSPTSSSGTTQTVRKRTYTLSKDGKTMTLETTTESPFMSNIQKQVYNRQ